MKNIIIFGASGHGSVVLDCIEKEGRYKVVGFMDSYKKKGLIINGYKILGNEFDLPFVIEKYSVTGVFVAVGDNWVRKILIDRITKINPNIRFISVVHPSASIGKDVEIGNGTVIMPGVIVNANTVIKDFCILNTNASLDHDGYMDDFSSLAPGVVIGGNLWLGKFSALSLGCKVVENITVGKHSIVGAASLVSDDVADYVTVYGSPARVISKRAIGDPYLSRSKRASSRLFISNDY
ncbi:acetyltransferase [Eudoraea sp.]|uniref:acetyltransferase n=1 Tax=Eudoraea sp. TaxID=1979955 RepID=UPI003C766389